MSDVTALDIQKLTDPTFIQATNQDALITYNIVNKAAMRDGQPMPDQGTIIIYQQTTNDQVAAIIRPPKGEVWKIQGISINNSASLSASQTYFTFLSNNTTDSLPQVDTDVFYSSIGSSSTNLPTESLFEEVFQPLLVTNTMFIKFYGNFTGTTGGHVLKILVGYQRVR